MPSSCRQPIFGAFRDQASDVILTDIPGQRSAKTRDRRTSDQPESGKHNKVLQMFSINVNLLTNLPMGPNRADLDSGCLEWVEQTKVAQGQVSRRRTSCAGSEAG